MPCAVLWLQLSEHVSHPESSTHVPMDIGTRLRHRSYADIRSSTRSGRDRPGNSSVPLRYAVLGAGDSVLGMWYTRLVFGKYWYFCRGLTAGIGAREAALQPDSQLLLLDTTIPDPLWVWYLGILLARVGFRASGETRRIQGGFFAQQNASSKDARICDAPFHRSPFTVPAVCPSTTNGTASSEASKVQALQARGNEGLSHGLEDPGQTPRTACVIILQASSTSTSTSTWAGPLVTRVSVVSWASEGGWSCPFVSGGQRVSAHILPHICMYIHTCRYMASRSTYSTVPCGLWCSVHNSLCPFDPHADAGISKSISSLQIDCNLNSLNYLNCSPPSPCLPRSRSRPGAELSSCLLISRMRGNTSDL